MLHLRISTPLSRTLSRKFQQRLTPRRKNNNQRRKRLSPSLLNVLLSLKQLLLRRKLKLSRHQSRPPLLRTKKLPPLMRNLRMQQTQATVTSVAEVEEVAVEVVVAAGEETASSLGAKAVDVVAEADTKITAKTPMASSRRLVRSQYAAEEDSSVENAEIAEIAATAVVTAVVTVEVTVVAIAATIVDNVIAPEAVLAPRMRVRRCLPKRPPRLNPSNPPTRNEYLRICEY